MHSKRLKAQVSILPKCMTSALEFILHLWGAISNVSFFIIIIIESDFGKMILNSNSNDFIFNIDTNSQND